MGSPTTLVAESLSSVSHGGPSWKPSEPALPTHRSLAKKEPGTVPEFFLSEPAWIFGANT